LDLAPELTEAVRCELLGPPEPELDFELLGWAEALLDPVEPADLAALLEVFGVVLLEVFGAALGVAVVKPPAGLAPSSEPDDLMGEPAASETRTDGVRPESAEPAGAAESVSNDEDCAAGTANLAKLEAGALAFIWPLTGAAWVLVLPSSTPVAPPSAANVC
jgi:hypothetical protein